MLIFKSVLYKIYNRKTLINKKNLNLTELLSFLNVIKDCISDLINY